MPSGYRKDSESILESCIRRASFKDSQPFQISGDMLEPLNIEARYPSYKERLMKSLTEDRCRAIIQQTDELRIWIKKKLSR